ncbi:transglycosylase domain-containing protein, partial [Oerskovia enterophila]|uniref:transglycosylase domain-containing protein n=1 Tax=Oerskovia enterophila TaxID=43678 RepID=UPI0008390D86
MGQSTRPRQQPHAVKALALLLAFLLVSAVGGVLAAGLLLPLAAGASAVSKDVTQLFDDLPDDLQPGPLSEKSRVFANDGTTLLATFYTENRIVVPLDEVSQHMKNAVVAIEDKRFYEHGGLDPEGVSRAAINNFTGGDTQGGSSLTQQYVKNVLIEQAMRDEDPIAVRAARDDTLGRKAREAKLAISLETVMTKDEILQGYLNIAQFGIRVYGVETASLHYFGKHASELGIVEAATIAGVTNAPTRYDPVTNPANSEARRNRVLDRMLQQEYITQQEHDEAVATPLPATLNVQPISAGCQTAAGAAFFCDYVTKVITSDPTFGETKKDRQALLYRGGLDITTTLDPRLQAAAEANITAAVPALDPSGLEDALVTVEPGTGKILAMAQNRPYDVAREPAPGTTAINYSADQLHGSSRGFSPGSTWKVFTLAEWLRSGHTLNDTVNANKRTFVPNKDFRASCARLDRIPWSPGNSDGSTDQGSIPVLRATFNSVNTAYASMESQLDLCGVRDMAWNAGLRPSITSELKGDASSIHVMPTMTIGTQNSSPLQMAAAYATFASGGTYCAPIAITRVVGAEGTDLPVPSANCTPNAVDPRIANTVTFALENVMTQGTAKKSQLSRPSAGKSGTANNNHHTWFIGYTPQLVTAVWIGNAENDVSMSYMRINGRYEKRWYGSTLAAPTWRSYMETALEGTPVVGFPGPDPAMARLNLPKLSRACEAAPNSGAGSIVSTGSW